MQSVCSCTWYTADTDLVMTLWYEDGATVVINPIRKYDVIVIGDNHYTYTDKYLLTYYVSSSRVNKTLLNCFGLEAWPEQKKRIEYEYDHSSCKDGSGRNDVDSVPVKVFVDGEIKGARVFANGPLEVKHLPFSLFWPQRMT